MPIKNALFQASLLISCGFIVLTGYTSMGLSLLFGLCFGLIIKNNWQAKLQQTASTLLKISIVVMGLGLNIQQVIETSQNNFWLTLVSILLTLIIGLLLGKLFKVEGKLSALITGGTAICGGSAIAALAPSIRAKPEQLVISISIVFLLNALALFIFPQIGHLLNLTQVEFGLWAALAIHDTSSVVGAAASYGEEALRIATTTKLARALWIIPLVFVATFYYASKQTDQLTNKITLPYFILFFIIASLLGSLIPQLESVTQVAPGIAKKGMALSLFLVGAAFTKDTLKSIQLNALWQAMLLWLLISTASLFFIILFL